MLTWFPHENQDDSLLRPIGLQSIVSFMAERPASVLYGNPQMRIPTDRESLAVLSGFHIRCGLQFASLAARRLPSTPDRTGPCWGMTAALRVRPVSPRSAVERTFKGSDHDQPLITDEQRAQLLANGRRHAAGQGLDPLPVVKLFTPDAHATWLLVSLDPDGWRHGLRPDRPRYRHA